MRNVFFSSGAPRARLSARRPAPVRFVPWEQWVFGLLRNVCPIFRFCRYIIVTRRDDVEEVLARSDVFVVPFAAEMDRLTDGVRPGTPFVLSTDDGRAHDEQQIRLMRVFRREDAVLVGSMSRRHARRIVEEKGHEGRLDAIRDLITEVPLFICARFLGVKIEEYERHDFVEALVALSGHLFGPPPIVRSKEIDRKADTVRLVVDRAISDARASLPSKRTVIGRLVRTEPRDSEVRAFLLGLIVGFVPTNTIAGGHILDLLLRCPRMMEESRKAALAGDDVRLGQCLFEVLRYKPINWGPFRLCTQDYVLGSNGRRKRRIRKGMIVLASTQSAMFDRKRVDKPYRFEPGRPSFDRLHFGYGIHRCVGAFVAQAQLVQTFKPLLQREDLCCVDGSDGKLRTWPGSIFPQHLLVRYRRSTS